MLRQDIRKPRRVAENEPDQNQQGRILPQQREQPPASARMKLRQKPVEHHEREFAMLALGQLVKQLRNEIHQLAAREFAAQSRIAAREPASDGRGDLHRIAKAQFREPVEGRAIVGLLLENQIGLRRNGRRFEQNRIMALNLLQSRDAARPRIPAGPQSRKIARSARCRRIGRQSVGLLVGDHLQAMLDRPQKEIRLFQFAARLAADPAAPGQHVERRQRLAAAQFRMAAARDQLLGLHEKLDLANAAATELDIEPFDRDFAVAFVGVDLPLHRVDVRDGGEIHVFPPHERATALGGTPPRPRYRRRKAAP